VPSTGGLVLGKSPGRDPAIAVPAGTVPVPALDADRRPVQVKQNRGRDFGRGVLASFGALGKPAVLPSRLRICVGC
jgi:hypothetical protein